MAPMATGLLKVQAALVLAGFCVTLFLKGPHAAVSALYGGGVALANALLLAKRVERAGELARDSAQRGVYSLYFGAVQRFVFVLLSLGIGLGLLGLDPLPLLAVFAIAQLAYLIAAGKQTV